MCIEALTGTQARMDWLRRTASRGEHVCSNRYLRRLWHQPEHGSTCSDHPHRRFGCCATLARARRAINQDRLPCHTALAGGVSDLALHLSEVDLCPRCINRCTPPISMSALNAPNLKLNSASISESSRGWETSRERACRDPGIAAACGRGELFHRGNLSATETHRLQDRRGSIGDERGEGGVKTLRTATHE